MNQASPQNANGAAAARNIQKLLKELITCMTQETLALRAHNQSVAGKMNEEKSRLATTYRGIAAELKKNPDIFSALDDESKMQLRILLQNFDLALKENFIAIKASKNAVARLIERLLKKARDAAGFSSRFYNQKGEAIDVAFKSGILPNQLDKVY